MDVGGETKGWSYDWIILGWKRGFNLSFLYWVVHLYNNYRLLTYYVVHYQTGLHV